MPCGYLGLKIITSLALRFRDFQRTKSYNRELSKKRVLVENCFAHVKDFKILRNLFPLQAKRYGTVFKAVALIYNLNLDEKLKQQQKVKATPMTA